jgi:peptidyl-tRNA hydrolase
VLGCGKISQRLSVTGTIELYKSKPDIVLITRDDLNTSPGKIFLAETEDPSKRFSSKNGNGLRSGTGNFSRFRVNIRTFKAVCRRREG